MAEITDTGGIAAPVARERVRVVERDHQAYRILHLAFIVAPTIAGVDKFFNVLTEWTQYLAPVVERVIPLSARGFMIGVGVVEMTAGLLVAIKPRIGAYVVAAWLGAIIVNLLIHGGFLDIALRDFGLMLGALALGRLAEGHERRHAAVATGRLRDAPQIDSNV